MLSFWLGTRLVLGTINDYWKVHIIVISDGLTLRTSFVWIWCMVLLENLLYVNLLYGYYLDSEPTYSTFVVNPWLFFSMHIFVFVTMRPWLTPIFCMHWGLGMSKFGFLFPQVLKWCISYHKFETTYILYVEKSGSPTSKPTS